MPLKTHLDETPTLNLTPMIDIVFLLIIFFMVGTKFTENEKQIGLDVPEVNDVGALTSAPEKMLVNLFKDGRITLDRQEVNLEQLHLQLTQAKAEYQDLGVLVRGDADIPFQNVATVLNTCRQAGISEMGISVRLAIR
ncbi:MAG: biopolymer transporter ExbD [Blastopirellula sp.]|nr:MAG: biopolymer transporter ExbD [Blastopirellula sp.]